MNIEIISIIVLLAVVWIILAAADALVAGVLALCFGAAFKKVFLWGLLSLAVPVVAVAYGILLERNWYQVKEVEFSFDNLPESFDGYRIVQLSDIHSRSFLKRTESLARAVNKVNDLSPDIIAFTGDIITISPEELDVTGAVLACLKAKDGIFSVLGNHDYGIYAKPGQGQVKAPDCSREIAAREQSFGWNFLLDEHRIITRGNDSIAVIGVQNTTPSRHFPTKGNLRKASAGTEGLFRILLSHDPMHWDMEVAGNDYPLTLSGHTHAAQFSLPGWCPSKYIFQQYRGLYDRSGQYLYVNIGLGETIVPIRFGARPEITVITLKRNNPLKTK